VQSNLSESMISMTMTAQGALFGWIFVACQLFMTCVAFVGCIPWIISRTPMGPAVRIAMDHTYFNIMLSHNSSEGVNGNTDQKEIWPKLDKVVRVGEALSSREDPDIGQIVMDKPKFVTTFSWTKRYV
jgi:hypothetical protein